MKNFIRLFFAFCVFMNVVYFVSNDASAETIASGSCGDSMTWTFYDTGLLYIGGSGIMDDYDNSGFVPWNSYSDEITSISFDHNIATIGDYAFADLKKAETAQLPGNLKLIGSYAFYNCRALEEIEIPSSVTSIGYNVFKDCKALKEIYACGDKYVALNGVLYNCEKTTLIKCPEAKTGEIILPATVTKIDDYAFYKCIEITNVELSENLNSIGQYAFYKCTVLEDIVLPETLSHIQPYTFALSGIKNLTFPNSITRIDDCAFEGCNSLENVYIDNLESWCKLDFLDSNSFDVENPLYHAENLYINGVLTTEIIIPEGVTSIGDGAFYGFSGIQSVQIPKSVISIGIRAFGSCKNLKTVETKAQTAYLGDAFVNCIGLESIVIPNGVETISRSFSGCINLKTITLPITVETILEDSFDGCSSLADVYYNGTESMWEDVSKVYSGNEELIALPTIHYTKDVKCVLLLDSIYYGGEIYASLYGVTEAGILIVASYKNSKLLDVGFIIVTEDSDTNIHHIISIGEADEIKCMFFDNNRTITPLCESAEKSI